MFKLGEARTFGVFGDDDDFTVRYITRHKNIENVYINGDFLLKQHELSGTIHKIKFKHHEYHNYNSGGLRIHSISKQYYMNDLIYFFKQTRKDRLLIVNLE